MNRKAISLVLAIFMLLSTIVSPSYAFNENLSQDKVKAGDDVQYSEQGNKKIFKIDKKAIQEVSEFRTYSLRSNIFSPLRAGGNTKKEQLTVNLTVKGLGNNSQNFNWNLFKNSKFTGKLVVYTVDDKEIYPTINDRPATIDFSQPGQQVIEYDIPVGLDIDSYNIIIDTMDNYEVRATYTEASTSPDGGDLEINFEVIEIANPVVEVIYQDSQGQNLANDKLPTTTGVNITSDVKLGGQSLNIPLPTAQSTKYNIAEGVTVGGKKVKAKTDELNKLTDAITYKVDNKDSGVITLDGKKFNLSITNSLETGTQIVLKAFSKAEEVKAAGGLEAVPFGVWKDTKVEGKFWNKGVKLATTVTDTDGKLAEALKAATVTDLGENGTIDTPATARTTAAAGDFTGNLKVEFTDGSTLVVNNQVLTVWENGTEITDDNKDKPKPDESIEVAFKAGKGIKNQTEGTVISTKLFKENTTLVAGDFPTVEKADDTYKAVEWTPADKKVTSTNKEFTANATQEGKPTAKYKDPTIEKGKSETVTPEVKDKDGNTVDKDKVKKPTITNENELPKDLKVTPDNEGKITITVPEDYNGPSEVVIKVKVPVDGITEPIETTITVTIRDKYVPVPEKSHEPIIDPIYDSDEVVTGKGEPGAIVEVEFPDKTVERVPVDRDGRWIVPVPYPLYEDDIVRARQIEDRKTPSDWVSQRVRYDEDFWRDRRDRRDKEEKEVKKPVEPKKVWTPDALNARDHFSYIKGYGNNMFAPNRTITRAEVAMIFARLSINQSTVGAPQFKDVKAGDWYKTAVDIMARQGVIKGYEDGTFRPNQPITRREFAAIAARYAGNIDAWKTFRDVPPTDWAYTLINRVAGAGWINGYEDGTFRPNNNITRAEVVAIVNRMLNRKADKKYVDNNLMRAKNAFVDNMRSAWYFYDIYEAAIGHSYERQPNGVDEKWNRVNGQSFEIRER